MLPATLAQDVRKQILHYLSATFAMRERGVEAALERFFTDPEAGLFKGPWVQARRPFRPATQTGADLFEIAPPFHPFAHQYESWKRLSSKGKAPKHTVVTTGTGSGKTECFLVPLLDHCWREKQAGRKGIKAIVLYPMNALATDQAGRFAEAILTSDTLSFAGHRDGKPARMARLRVGLYTGRTRSGSEDRGDDEPGTYAEMTFLPPRTERDKPEYKSITNRKRMQDDPPDILLTNYKMLDYLMIRPKDQGIWQHNHDDPACLQYLVLDEIHTYDGAQGADVACLIRRLKSKLQVPDHHLCMVGTSATIAGEESEEQHQDPINRLCAFAGSLFEENIPSDAVILEDRLDVGEIIGAALAEDQVASAEDCTPQSRETALEYAKRIGPAFGAPGFPLEVNSEWLPQGVDPSRWSDADVWQFALGAWVRRHGLFKLLLTQTRDGVVAWNELLQNLAKEHFAFRSVGDFEARSEVLSGFLALVAQARELRSERSQPLVPTQVQFWIRELRRIGKLVSDEPIFTWLDEPLPDRKQLPAVHCSACGEVAWVSLHDPDMDSVVQRKCQGFAVIDEVRRIYDAWGFEGAAKQGLTLFSPWREGDDPLPAEQQQSLNLVDQFVGPTSLVLRSGAGPCPLSGEQTFRVKLVRETRQKNNRTVGVRRCPHCGEEDQMFFLGSRAATVGSVAIDEMFGSTLNNDPKLLAFTDSVQDASHRAGFFSARTYHFTFRTALQHVIDEAGDAGLPVEKAAQAIVDYWSQDLPGRPGSIREVMATLMPPDLREYQPYLDFRNSAPNSQAPASLTDEFLKRLVWEVASEFSLMLTHGRTMEVHASATLGWDPERVAETIRNLRERLPGISPSLQAIDDDTYLRWLLGVLHRQRERGGLYHAYLDDFARQNFWGKFPFGRTIAGRECYPSGGRFKPRLMVLEPNRNGHDHVLAPAGGNNQPWQLVWARRVLEAPGVDDASLLDLIRALFQEGQRAGLFKRVHQDGTQQYYAIDSAAARLFAAGSKLEVAGTGLKVFRPVSEASVWQRGPSLSYRDDYGTYQPADLNERERYYRERYRKGALCRVFAHEHTGLLETEEREQLEDRFSQGTHADDPNVLTATSTLEMGIDIGDLSATMLCSVPPSVASYLQRIGRAGRKTGTALVLTIINQRPHDLFFFARPMELLNGAVEPPGCWLDACAVLVRQYFAFCFDQAVRQGALVDLPSSGTQLIAEVLEKKSGHIPGLLEWMTLHEAALQQQFVDRFRHDVMADTEEQFLRLTRTEQMRERVEKAAHEHDVQRQLLRNAQNRLKDQKQKINPETEADALKEIEREQRILRNRSRKLGETSALEVLIEHGLLPNYAFPERGVKFNGTTINQYARNQGDAEESLRTYEMYRPGASALRELAPWNRFYTHSHMFEIQQLEIGSANEPLIEQWAICGRCGHMRTVPEATDPQSHPSCPQCGHDGQEGQTDMGQHQPLLPFHRSQAISYMEYYESLSGDRGEERESSFYQTATLFDHQVEKAVGAVGEDSLPFGIEFRPAIRMRELNAGFRDQQPSVTVGIDQRIPDGFDICAGCGVVLESNQSPQDAKHRRSCPGRRQTEAMHRAGQAGSAYTWQKAMLYRELRSEAIRLLLPEVNEADLDTLEAAIYLGLRIRFQGNPAHLLVRAQQVPDASSGVTRNYLVLMDAVPGGTGFLKTLFQEKDGKDRTAEGIVDILRRARDVLETCACRRLQQTQDDADGCYRCIRTYHMQRRAENISRERGIALLNHLIVAAERREVRKTLEEINPTSLFGSVLEKRFIERLKQWVLEGGGQWQETLINGDIGFQFSIGGHPRVWSVERFPKLGPARNVSIQCEPDFLLFSDETDILPVAIFTDGFEFHVEPHKEVSRLPDDVRKRRAILESGRFHVWGIAWDDLSDDADVASLSFLRTQVVDNVLKPEAAALRSKGRPVPDIANLTGNGFHQLLAFIQVSEKQTWAQLASQSLGKFMSALAIQGTGVEPKELISVFERWTSGESVTPLKAGDEGSWLWLNRLAETEDLLASAENANLTQEAFASIRPYLRLDDALELRQQQETYKKRWRRWLAMLNLYQFCKLTIFATSEVSEGTGPDLDLATEDGLPADWQALADEALPSLTTLIQGLYANKCLLPQAEYDSDEVGEEYFAELAWPGGEKPLAFLAGDQASAAKRWQSAGWRVATDKDLQARGLDWFLGLVPKIDHSEGA